MNTSCPGYLELLDFLRPRSSKADRKLILYIACDFLNHLGARAVPFWDKFMAEVMKDILDKDVDLRQPACYSITLAAKQSAFAPHALKIATDLKNIVVEARSRTK